MDKHGRFAARMQTSRALDSGKIRGLSLPGQVVSKFARAGEWDRKRATYIRQEDGAPNPRQVSAPHLFPSGLLAQLVEQRTLNP